MLLFLTPTFSVAPLNHKLQRKLLFIQNGVVSKKIWHFFYRNLKLPLHFNLELSHVALSHVLPYFPTLKLPSLHVVIFRHPHLTHMKSNSNFSSAMNSTHHFLHIYHLDFHLKKFFLPSKFEKILWSNKVMKVFPCRNYFFGKSR
jgi:hypothetical protein